MSPSVRIATGTGISIATGSDFGSRSPPQTPDPCRACRRTDRIARQRCARRAVRRAEASGSRRGGNDRHPVGHRADVDCGRDRPRAAGGAGAVAAAPALCPRRCRACRAGLRQRHGRTHPVRRIPQDKGLGGGHLGAGDAGPCLAQGSGRPARCRHPVSGTARRGVLDRALAGPLRRHGAPEFYLAPRSRDAAHAATRARPFACRPGPAARCRPRRPCARRPEQASRLRP